MITQRKGAKTQRKSVDRKNKNLCTLAGCTWMCECWSLSASCLSRHSHIPVHSGCSDPQECGEVRLQGLGGRVAPGAAALAHPCALRHLCIHAHRNWAHAARPEGAPETARASNQKRKIFARFAPLRQKTHISEVPYIKSRVDARLCLSDSDRPISWRPSFWPF